MVLAAVKERAEQMVGTKSVSTGQIPILLSHRPGADNPREMPPLEKRPHMDVRG